MTSPPRRAPGSSPRRPLTIAVTGSGGLIGTALTALLSTGGHHVIRLVRRLPRHAGERYWRPEDPGPDLLSGVDALIHLAGASIGGRFTAGRKQEIRDSRITPDPPPGRARGRWPNRGAPGLRAFVTASAIGIYGPDRGDEVLTETSARGDGFLADVVAGWEDATAPAARAGLRTVQVRTGIVQSPRGGMLRLLYPLFAAGLGGRLGSGKQWLSWIGLDDLLDIYLRAALDPALSGPVNAVAPTPVRNADYTAVLAGLLHRPALVPVPAFGPRAAAGRRGRPRDRRGQPVRPPAAADQRRAPVPLPRARGGPAPRARPRASARPGNPDPDRPRIRTLGRQGGAIVTGRRIAVIGGGISGLTAGYVLSRTDHVTLFEADRRLGGHADTHLVGPVPVDTGFIVYNERTYPLLTRLFAELGVSTRAAEMSMSVRCAGCGLHYAGKRGPGGLAAGLRRGGGRFLRLLADVPRFHRAARELLADRSGPGDSAPSASSWTAAGTPATSRPTSRCRWSRRCGRARPARRKSIPPATCSPSWPTTGCCRCPARRPGGPWPAAPGATSSGPRARLACVRLGVPVRAVRRYPDGAEVRDASGQAHQFDAVVIATHPDQALRAARPGHPRPNARCWAPSATPRTRPCCTPTPGCSRTAPGSGPPGTTSSATAGTERRGSATT